MSVVNVGVSPWAPRAIPQTFVTGPIVIEAEVQTTVFLSDRGYIDVGFCHEGCGNMYTLHESKGT